MVRYSTVLLVGAMVILGSLTCEQAPAYAASFPQPSNWPPILAADRATEVLGPGVTYDRWQLQTGSGPLIVHVTTVDLRNPYVSFAVATQHDAIVGSGEPLSSMADRAHAEAAINGDYFDINESNSPLGIAISSGQILHHPNGAAALVVGANNAMTMGPVTLRATLASSAGAKLDVGFINDWSKGSVLSILTSRFGSTEAGGAAEIVLTPISDAGTYRVSHVERDLTTLLPLGDRELGVAARGAQAAGLLEAFKAGDTVSVTFSGTPPPSSILAAIGGGPLLLRDGQPVADPSAPAPQETNVRYPVTGAGVSADGATLLLVAVDGRAPTRSVGITRPMFASLLASLGAAQAMAFDSGGSTEMAIRHLGDLSVSVANTPSDGRERSIADGLLVVNAAPPGPVARVFLRSDKSEVLIGSHLQIRVAAVDANDQPVALDGSRVAYYLDPLGGCVEWSATGVLTAVAPCTVRVGARYDAVDSENLIIAVAPSLANIAIDGYRGDVATLGKIPLSAIATGADGARIAVDSDAITWSASGDGSVLADGTFVAGASPGSATVTANAGGAHAALQILVGDHAVVVQPVPHPGAGMGMWHYAASPSSLTGTVDALAAPDGAAALHLAYDFPSGGGSRAAYANSEIPLAGEPLAVSIAVYGDGNGEWLRGAYRNADGIVDGLTIARHVDWTGWRTIRVAMPPQVRWPLVWTRLYAVEPRRDAIEHGAIWFRDLTFFYAGA
jgi:hypothetical protein